MFFFFRFYKKKRVEPIISHFGTQLKWRWPLLVNYKLIFGTTLSSPFKNLKKVTSKQLYEISFLVHSACTHTHKFKTACLSIRELLPGTKWYLLGYFWQYSSWFTSLLFTSLGFKTNGEWNIIFFHFYKILMLIAPGV